PRLAVVVERRGRAADSHSGSRGSRSGNTACRNNRSGAGGKERSRAESESCGQAGKESSGEEGCETEEGEGISHGSPSLSNHPPADHHGERPGRERAVPHGGLRGCGWGDQDGDQGSGPQNFQGNG